MKKSTIATILATVTACAVSVGGGYALAMSEQPINDIAQSIATPATVESTSTQSSEQTSTQSTTVTSEPATDTTEWQQRAVEMAETYNSNTHTDAEIIVLTTSSLCVEDGLSDADEIESVQNFLTDNGWNRSYWDESEPEEQGAMVPLLVTEYYWRQTGRNGNQEQSDRIGRVGVALSHDGYTTEQIEDLTTRLENYIENGEQNL